MQGLVDLQRLSAALAELLETEVAIVLGRVSTDAPRLRPKTTIGFELGANDTVCALSVEPEFAIHVLGLVLRRSVGPSTSGELDAALSGAFSAWVLELARRCGAREAFHLLTPSVALERASEVFVGVTVLLAGTAYPVVVACRLPELSPEAPVELSALGELPIALPLVIGQSLADRRDLADFVPGNAWFPGPGLWLDQKGEGSVALAPGSGVVGVAGTLSGTGEIVLRGNRVPLLPDAGELMSDSGKAESSLTEAVLDSPVVVRVEMGAVSMTAREWAELGPGDVIETGRRIAEPVVLRVAGREVARGELVNLEGELGVRIREVIRS